MRAWTPGGLESLLFSLQAVSWYCQRNGGKTEAIDVGWFMDVLPAVRL